MSHIAFGTKNPVRDEIFIETESTKFDIIPEG